MYLAPWEERRKVLLAVAGGIVLINIMANLEPGEETMTGDYLCDSMGWRKRKEKLKAWGMVLNVKAGDETMLLARQKEMDGVLEGMAGMGDEGMDLRQYGIGKIVANTSFYVPGGDEDLVVLTDASDIPSNDAVRIMQECVNPSDFVVLEMQAYLYDFGCKERRKKPLHAGYIIQRSKLMKFCTNSSLSSCVESLLPSRRPRPVPITAAGWRLGLFNEREADAKSPDIIRGTDVQKCFQVRCLHPNMKNYGDRQSLTRLRNTGPKAVRVIAFNPKHPEHHIVNELYTQKHGSNQSLSCAKVADKIREAARNGHSPFSGIQKKRRTSQTDLRDALAYANRLTDPVADRQLNLTGIVLAVFFFLTILFMVLSKHCKKKPERKK
eukprot:TRINITY_DN7830_c0_g2_i1.p1 TRINITY_DN7830_c0_g2~~TRINITY_DN7830_c0_g2_i1.p1  ORF type:complete len:381 (+),score=71.92 TRINITY_DN7830_c0_g2_i1:31-1173(+)